MARKHAAVAAGVGTTMPVFAARAGDGLLEDVDGNLLIDLGSGIAVTSVGASHPRVVRGRAGAGGALHPHLLHGDAVRGLRRRRRAAQRADPGRPREALGAVQLRRRGRRERRQDRAAGDRPLGGRRLRPRLPRPHQPDDGDDGEGDALQARLRPVRAGGLPRAAVLPVPRRRAERAGGGRRALDQVDKQVGAANLAALVIEPVQGEGGFIVPAPGFLPALADWCREHGVAARRRRGADRLRPHRRDVRLRARGRRPRPDRHGQGHRRRPAAVGGHRPGRGHGRRAPRRPGRHVRRQPDRLRRRARRDGRPRRGGPRRTGAGDIGTVMEDRLHRLAAARPAHRRGPRPRRDGRRRARRARARPRPTRRSPGPSPPPPTPAASSC